MHYQRIVLRATLGGKNIFNGVSVERVRRKTVDSLRGYGDKLALLEQTRRLVKTLLAVFSVISFVIIEILLSFSRRSI